MKIRCVLPYLFTCSTFFSSNIALAKDTAKLSPPIDQETCFSPDEPCADKLIKFIQSAKKSIDIAIYSISLEDLVDVIVKKSEQIPIRIVCDKVQSHGVKSQVLHLLEKGIPIRYGKQKGIMHDKFVIVDHQMIETGSFNFTNGASNSNQENQVYLANPKIVNRFADRFESMWEKSAEIDMKHLETEMMYDLESFE